MILGRRLIIMARIPLNLLHYFSDIRIWIDLNKTPYIYINNATPFEKFFPIKYANLESAIIRSGSQGKLISI